MEPSNHRRSLPQHSASMHAWSVGWTLVLFACSGRFGQDDHSEPVGGLRSEALEFSTVGSSDTMEADAPESDIVESPLPSVDESYAAIRENSRPRWTTPDSPSSDPCTRFDPPTWRNGWTENMGGWCRHVHQYFDGKAIYHCTYSYSRMSLYHQRTYGTGYGRGGERCTRFRLWETSVEKIQGEEKTRLEISKQSKGLFDDCHESCRRFKGELFVGLVISINDIPLHVTVSGTDNRAILDCVEQKARGMVFSSRTFQSASLVVRFISRTYEEVEAEIVQTGPPENAKDETGTCEDFKEPSEPTTTLPDDPTQLKENQ